MAILSINNLSKDFNGLLACKNIDLELEDNSIMVILGESGSGKSTLLNLIAGFEHQNSGEISLDNQFINSDNIFIKPEKRNIGLIFQQDSLFPHFSIAKNIEYAASKKFKNNYDFLLEELGILNIKNKMPHECSGGERQRATLVRCLVNEPRLILMDEPFSSLDESTKDNIRTVFYKYLKKNKIPSIIVSHDINDALILADRVAVMNSGKIIEIGDPKDIASNSNSFFTNQLFNKVSVFDVNDIDNNFELIQSESKKGRFFINSEFIQFQNGGVLTPLWSKYYYNNYLNYLEYKSSIFYFYSDKDLTGQKIKLIIDIDKSNVIS